MVSIEQDSDGLPFVSGDVWLPPEPDEDWYDNLKEKYPKPADRILYVANIAAQIESRNQAGIYTNILKLNNILLKLSC